MGWLNNLLGSGRNPDSVTDGEFYDGFEIPCKRRSGTVSIKVGENVNLWSSEGDEIRIYSRGERHGNDLYVAWTKFDKLAKHLQEKREYTATITNVTSNRIQVDVVPQSPENKRVEEEKREENLLELLFKPISPRSEVSISFRREPFDLKPGYRLNINSREQIVEDSDNLKANKNQNQQKLWKSIFDECKNIIR